jgi:hypothetical protein
MTVVLTIVLIIGMGLLGVPIILGLLSPLAGAVVTRALPESAWDGAMFAFAQSFAALATFLIGWLVLELPWYAALIAALVIGLTTYARRAPE